MRASLIASVAILATAFILHAEPKSSDGWFGISQNARFETGDSWSDGGEKFRLYGVQACLRGTSFTNHLGLKRDCGEASLAMLVAMIRDLAPRCTPVVAPADNRVIAVSCFAVAAQGSGKGANIDLGTALIASGFAFAAMTSDGQAIHPPYIVAQTMAAWAKAGLWAFADLPDPNAIILQAIQQTRLSGIADTPGRLP